MFRLVAICTRTEMEDFLREAACMKEFDHQNVMRLLGENQINAIKSFLVTSNGTWNINKLDIDSTLQICCKPFSSEDQGVQLHKPSHNIAPSAIYFPLLFVVRIGERKRIS